MWPALAMGPLGRLARRLCWLVAAFAAVEGLIVLFGVRPYYIPRPSLALAAIMATPAPYVQGFLRTFSETLLGFLAGGLFGIGMGIVFFRARALRELVFPIFVVSQTIPVIAFGALVVLWFGNTLLAKAAIAFYLTFFPVTVNTLLGLESVDPGREALMRSFGATQRQLMTRLQLPGALPQIFVALRLASALALVGAIVGEWFGDTVGLGVLLLQGMYTENVVAIWAALFGCALLGTGFYASVAAAERIFVFWSAEQ
jgi:NitT/TauT family transport system permease protein